MYLNGAWSRAVGGDQVVVRMKEVKSFTALLGRVLPRQHALGERARSGSAGEPEIDAGTTPITIGSIVAIGPIAVALGIGPNSLLPRQ